MAANATQAGWTLTVLPLVHLVPLVSTAVELAFVTMVALASQQMVVVSALPVLLAIHVKKVSDATRKFSLFA